MNASTPDRKAGYRMNEPDDRKTAMNALLNVVPNDEPRKRTSVGLPDSLWSRAEKLLEGLNKERERVRKRRLTRDEFFEYALGWVFDELEAQEASTKVAKKAS